jgi:hypothetical protein
MFPEALLRNIAREAGVVMRERKVDPVVLFWALTLGLGVRFLKKRQKRYIASQFWAISLRT